MSLTYSHGREFVEQARILLETADSSAFTQFLKRYWPADTLRELLDCGHDDAINIALIGLSLVGSMEDCHAVAPWLHADDGTTAGFAEHALWSIWFRAGGENAHAQLTQAVRHISENDLEQAVQKLVQSLADSSDYAEAYHQLAMIEFLRGDYTQAVTHCRAALILNPWHFGAMAGLGHCYAAASQFEKAKAAYQRALELNPRLEGVRQAIRQLRKALPQSQSTNVNQFTNL